MPVFQGATFPPLGWIPDTDRLNAAGEGLLDVAYGALEQHGLHDRYERRVVGHGREVPVEPDKANQLTVTCPRIFPGRAGEEQFQFAKGSPGKLAFRTAAFTVKLTRPYAKRQGVPAVPTTAIDSARALLWVDGWVVWSALFALAMGGVTHPAFPSVDDLYVGPFTAADPAGGEASWSTDVLALL